MGGPQESRTLEDAPSAKVITGIERRILSTRSELLERKRARGRKRCQKERSDPKLLAFYKSYRRAYYLRNKEKLLARQKERREDPVIRRKSREATDAWMARNREHLNQYARQYQRLHSSTVKYKLNSRMRTGIGNSLRGKKVRRAWESLVLYTVEDLRKRLESTMPDGYNWKDFISGELHIDHILPLKSFSFENSEDVKFKEAWSLQNLQLLPRLVNLSKGAKLNFKQI